MSQEASEIQTAQKRTLRSWLFNPFRYVAGGTALGLGLAAIVGAGLIGSLNRVHFDGVLDAHVGGPEAPWWVFITEGIIDWLSLAMVLTVLAAIIPPRGFRVIDVFGTAALARWPMLLTALAVLPPGFTIYYEQWVQRSKTAVDTTSSLMPALPPFVIHVIFLGALCLVIISVIWMVALMYRGFAVSCHLKGAKAVFAFIAGLILAEILSKIALWLLLIRFMPNSSQM
jgi:hypothetical protein